MFNIDPEFPKVPSRPRLILASVDPDLLREIDRLAGLTDRSRSDIICRCLSYSLDHLEIADPE